MKVNIIYFLELMDGFVPGYDGSQKFIAWVWREFEIWRNKIISDFFQYKILPSGHQDI